MKPTIEQIKQLYPPGTVVLPAHIQSNITRPGEKRKLKDYIYTITESDFSFQGGNWYANKTSNNKGTWNTVIYETDSNTFSAIITDLSDLNADISKHIYRIPSLSDLVIPLSWKIPITKENIDYVNQYKVQKNKTKVVAGSWKYLGDSGAAFDDGNTWSSNPIITTEQLKSLLVSPSLSSTPLPSTWIYKITAENLEKVNAFRNFLGYNTMTLSDAGKFPGVRQNGGNTSNMNQVLLTDSQFDEVLKSKGIFVNSTPVANKVIEIPNGKSAVAIRCIKDCLNYKVGDITWVHTTYLNPLKGISSGACIHPEDNKHGENYYDCFELIETPKTNVMDLTRDLGEIEFLRNYPDILAMLVQRSVSKTLDSFMAIPTAGPGSGGFTWDEQPEGRTFWRTILEEKRPEHYYTKFPKTGQALDPVILNPVTGLREKWLLKVTNENVELVNRYREKTEYNHRITNVYNSTHIDETGYSGGDSVQASRPYIFDSDFITFLKNRGIDTIIQSKDVGGSIVSPNDKWIIQITAHNIDLINRWRKTKSYYTFGKDYIGNYIDYQCSYHSSKLSGIPLLPDYQFINHLVGLGIDVSNPNNPFPIADLAARASELHSEPKELKTVQVGMIPVK